MQTKPLTAVNCVQRETKREEKQKRGKFKKIKSNDDIKSKLPEPKSINLDGMRKTLVEKPPLSQTSLMHSNTNLRKTTAIVTPNTSQISPKPCNINTNNSELGQIVKNQLPPHNSSTGTMPKLVNAVPPLINMNPIPVPMPRVQTIQLTPQKQQALKNVQLQIQQFSARLQNKALLSTITQEYDPSNPLHNKPMPTLTNCNTDSEIHEALQILFIEQQKILATGKLIPNISAASFMATPPTMSPIAPTSNPPGAFIGGSLQTVPSPVQINSPQVKQESGTPSPMVISNSSPSAAQTVVTSPQITGASIGHNVYAQRISQPSSEPGFALSPASVSPAPQEFRYQSPPEHKPMPVPVPSPPPPPASPKIKVPRPHL